MNSTPSACPPKAIGVRPGESIQDAVSGASVGASFCIRAGTHRMQYVEPKARQRFYGEDGAVMNGARLLKDFTRENELWVASGQTQRSTVRGQCASTQPACSLPEALFIDDKPLMQVTNKAALRAGSFYFDYAERRIYFVDDPTNKKVEATAASFAFRSFQPDVFIKNLIVEKYSSPAQEGAIQGEFATGWVVENCEIRFNSGAGVAVGSGGKLLHSKLHHNGQLGATAGGVNILMEGNEIAHNNIYGFNPYWEAGGVKITESDGVVLRNNHSHHNVGAGLWCDINVYNAVYEGNLVEYNQDAGIFHEISYAAIIRDNTVRFNGLADKGWVWGADIQIAASQNVKVYRNVVEVRNNGAGIVLIDQGRTANRMGKLYKTTNNIIHDNRITFDGRGSMGGVSDTSPLSRNYNIIERGNNCFDRNTYRTRDGFDVSFFWGHSEYDLKGFQKIGHEVHGIETKC
uniref:Right handed beta helix domain-containing protein n=1 Tax=Rhodopseudomonas palustris (strain BisA53) TaxID=316055 RepID=Q07KW3_RHOP5